MKRTFTILALGASVGAFAFQFEMQFLDPSPTVLVGETFSLRANLVNLEPFTVYLNSATLTTIFFDADDWQKIIVTDTVLDNAPFALRANETWTGEVAKITVEQGAKVGHTSTANLTLFGGVLDSDTDVLDHQNFTVTTAVPEPASLAILGLGLGILARRRQRIG